MEDTPFGDVFISGFGESDEDDKSWGDAGGMKFTVGDAGNGSGSGLNLITKQPDKAATRDATVKQRSDSNRKEFVRISSRPKVPRQVARSQKRKSDIPIQITCLCSSGTYNEDCPVCDEPPRRKETAAQKRDRTIDNKALSVIEASSGRKAVIELNKLMTEQLNEYQSVTVTTPEEQTIRDSVIDIWAGFEPKTDDSTEGAKPASVPLELAKVLKPHQIEGLRFLWANVVVTKRRWKEESNPSLGCILAHSMGLGKTAQTVIFVSLLIQLGIVRTVLILAPKSTMSNWGSEIEKWSEMAGLKVPQVAIPDASTIPQRLAAIKQWESRGGALTIGYEQYCGLTGAYTGRNNIPKHMAEKLLELLRDPGPDLVICDEGHVIRNANASVSKSLSAIKTNRRVILTGTPLQNHLGEYWTMIDFIRPGHFPKKEFVRYFEHPMIMGQKADADRKSIELMRKRAYILQTELSPFVHRRDQTILKKDLPRKDEYVVYCPLSKPQAEIFETFRTAYLNAPGDFHNGASKNMLYFISVVNKLGGHPDLLRNFLLEKKKNFDLGESTRPGEFTWAERTLLSDTYQTGRVVDSPKLLTLLLIVEYIIKNRQKLLVFSQYVQSLDFLESQIKRLTKGHNTWRLDGGSSGQSRADSIAQFQKHSGWGVFLISTRAGGVGINLCTAHKAVLFDVSFNPALDQQAIFRGYRYGLKHPVTIYRLVSDGTPEAHIFSSCVSKEWMAKKIVDHDVPSRANVKGTGLSDIYDDITELMDGSNEAAEVTERLKKETQFCLEQNALLKHFNEKLRATKGIELSRVIRHESLLLDDENEKAGDAEKKAYEEYIDIGGIMHASAFDGFNASLVTGSSLWDLPDFSESNDPWSVDDTTQREGCRNKKQKANPMAYLDKLVESTSSKPIQLRTPSEFGVQKLL